MIKPKLRLTHSSLLTAGAAGLTYNENVIKEAMQNLDRSQENANTIPRALLTVGQDSAFHHRLRDIGEWRHMLVTPELQEYE